MMPYEGTPPEPNDVPMFTTDRTLPMFVALGTLVSVTMLACGARLGVSWSTSVATMPAVAVGTLGALCLMLVGFSSLAEGKSRPKSLLGAVYVAASSLFLLGLAIGSWP